jgi:hypothetical protein
VKPALIVAAGLAGVIVLTAFVYLQHTETSEPLFTKVTHREPNASAGSSSSGSGDATESLPPPQAPADKPPSNSSPNSKVRRGAQASVPTDANFSAVGANEHQRIAKGLADAYIANMYTDEKAKEPMPEMAAVMHNQFSKESPDQNWGPATQQSLENYLNSSLAAMGSDLDVANVSCKATICEIIGVVQDMDQKDVNGIMSRWEQVTRQMSDQPWWMQNNLGQPQYEVAMGPSNSTLLFIYLLRQGTER